jgi:hypothetical protein
VTVDFTTRESCGGGKTGAHAYDVTSTVLGTANSGPGGTTILVFKNLNITDETAKGKPVGVVCTRWTLQVEIIPGSGPRAARVSFTVLDGDGNIVWSSGSGALREGSVAA